MYHPRGPVAYTEVVGGTPFLPKFGGWGGEIEWGAMLRQTNPNKRMTKEPAGAPLVGLASVANKNDNN